MLYDYKFTLAQMGQLKNYKKNNNFNYTLLSVEDLELPTFEINCKISYKKTVPLNLFEKYSIRLIEKAYEKYTEMSIEKISSLLHLDKNLIKENLENLEVIGMLNNINSDDITINRAKNAEYLRYENKFRFETLEQNYHLTKVEYDDRNNFIEKEFRKRNKDKKYQSSSILNEKKSTKSVNLLNFSDNQFLIFSKNAINSNGDLKFIDEKSLNNKNTEVLPDNIFCHYDEFLLLLKDRINDSDNIVVIGSKEINKSYLNILPLNNNVYILSNDNKNYKRVFEVESDDFVWIENEIYTKVDRFVIKVKDYNYKKEVKQKLENYFNKQILEIEPHYNLEKNKDIDNQINFLKNKLDSFKFKTKKEVDSEIQRINTEKNKLYGLTHKNAQTRSKARQRIDKFENDNNQEELDKYQEYLKNRDKIIDLKRGVSLLEEESRKIIKLSQNIAELNNKKSKTISKENKQKINIFEKELKNLQVR
jgi:hypothetical protein